MEKENEALAKMLDALCEKNPTEEQKMICALVKKALFADSLLAFIDEVSKAFEGKGKVSADSVKNTIEFSKANNEVQIRNLSISNQEKDEMVKQEANRLKVVEVWTLGTLAHFGLLK